jgi:hypothetical protein
MDLRHTAVEIPNLKNKGFFSRSLLEALKEEDEAGDIHLS